MIHIQIFDSIFKNVDSQTKTILKIDCLYTSTIKVVNPQKQKCVQDCGLFAIAFLTKLVLSLNIPLCICTYI